ncbi:MAG: hypothetical protein WC333_07080 [Dehalococcoidia bacterium]
MKKLRLSRFGDVADTTFIFLVIALTLLLLIGRFAGVHHYVNMDYLLAIILLIGVFSILLRSE